MYRTAIIGCGRIASTMDDDPKRKYVASHAGAYTAVKKTKLVAAADIDKNRLETFGKRWNVKSLYTDYREMLEKENIDMLSICTWNSTHHEITKAAVKAGVKAIFCEKPISDTLKSADEMIKICRKNRVVLAVNHQRRWDEFHQNVKQFIDAGKIGNVQQVNFYYVAGIANSGSHMFDLLRFFFGDVKLVWGVYKGNKSADDPNTDGYLTFRNGITATIQSLDVNSYYMFDTNIFGTKALLNIKDAGFNAEIFMSQKSKLFSGYNQLQKVKLPFSIGKKQMMIWAIEDIINSIEHGKNPRCTGEDGRASLELICAFHESAKNNGKTIKLPLKNRNLKIKSK